MQTIDCVFAIFYGTADGVFLIYLILYSLWVYRKRTKANRLNNRMAAMRRAREHRRGGPRVIEDILEA